MPLLDICLACVPARPTHPSRQRRRDSRGRIVALVLLLAAGAARSEAQPAIRAAAPPAGPIVANTTLARYIGAPDSSYRFTLAATVSGDGYTAYILDLTSQTWRTSADVDKPVWRHWLTVIRPTTVRHRTGMLMISGGSNTDPQPTRLNESLVRIAVATQSVVAEVLMVPNQPLQFTGEPRPRMEDEIIAYSWDRYLTGGDETWPLRLPMTKAAVRAMDAVSSFGASQGFPVDSFVLSGGSKRAWTAWSTAAVDGRVVGLIPIVYDNLNFEPATRHHLETYGYWAPVLQPYEDLGVLPPNPSPRYATLMAIEDPFAYRAMFTMPKYLIASTGDQFFLPDSWRFYADSLPGTTLLRYVPNTDHGVRAPDLTRTMQAFYHALLHRTALPAVTATEARDGTVRVRVTGSPTQVLLWQATNPTARDFRLSTLGPRWKSSPIEAASDGSYVVRVPAPARGHTGYFVEATFRGPDAATPLKVTTGVRVRSAVAAPGR